MTKYGTSTSKTGKVQGFSIEGLFEHEFVKRSNDFYDTELLQIMNEETDFLLSQIRALIKKDKRTRSGERIEMESYSDYGQSIRNNARRGIELNEKNNNKCGTQVGKVRAQQLADGKPISLQTIKRMHSYLNRAETYYDNADSQNDCGYISYLLWGGKSALSWSRNKLRELGELEENQQPSITSTYPGEAGIRTTQSLEITTTVDGLPLYETEEEALQVAERIGCQGTHIHEVGGRELYMPCQTHTETQDRILSSLETKINE